MPRILWPITSLLLLLPSSVSAAPKTFSSDEDVSIIGEYLKPDITVVISRENLNKSYDLQLDEDFLQKIIDSVKSAPF